MALSRAVLAPLCSLALAAGAAEDELAFRVAPHTTLTRTVKSSHVLELESMVLSLNGEEVEDPYLATVGMHVERTETRVVTDVIESVAGARPEKLTRTFDELGAEEHTTFRDEDGEEGDDGEYASALEGKTVVFTWDEESEGFAAAFAEGAEGADEDLAGLQEDMDLRAFLPPGPVAAGDTWELEPALFGRILDPGGDVELQRVGDEVQDSSAMDAALRANLAGKITATYKGVQEEDGLRLAVIELAADTSTHASEELSEEDGGGTSTIEAAYELGGELRWDLAHGHALALELVGPHRVTMTHALTSEIDGERFDQGQTVELSGELRFSLTIERR